VLAHSHGGTTSCHRDRDPADQAEGDDADVESEDKTHRELVPARMQEETVAVRPRMHEAWDEHRGEE